MTIKTVEAVATRFLEDDSQKVLVLKGAWGVGKTYIWNKIIKENKDKINPRNYCYVSLFGISSISDLRTTIFVKAYDGNFNLLESGKKIASFMAKLNIPYIGKNLSIAFESIAPHLIKNTLICLDDLERTNEENIKVDELLGFISELKEEKNCKVVLILNEDELKNKSNQSYEKYREKVIDIDLLFAPTPIEAAELAIPDTLPHKSLVKERTTSLGINNIRVLRKIVELVNMVHKEIMDFHADVFDKVITTLVLLVWCYYDKNENKPSFEFVMKLNEFKLDIAKKTRKKEDKEQKFENILNEYGLYDIDELDISISKIIEHGYIEESGFKENAAKFNERVRRNHGRSSFLSACGLLHNTFSKNTNEVVETFSSMLKKEVMVVYPCELNQICRVLREIQYDDKADELIDFYVNNRNQSSIEFFNLDLYTGFNEITDERIKAKFKEKYDEMSEPISLKDAVNQIATNSWHHKHTQVLMKSTTEDFIEFFKLENHGENLAKTIRACLQSGLDQAITKKVQDALTTIGNESLINSIRVQKFGIQISESQLSKLRLSARNYT